MRLIGGAFGELAAGVDMGMGMGTSMGMEMNADTGTNTRLNRGRPSQGGNPVRTLMRRCRSLSPRGLEFIRSVRDIVLPWDGIWA
jgi:hypothetical protein